MAHDLSPWDRDLYSQSTISRLENLPDARALLRMGRAMIDLPVNIPALSRPRSMASTSATISKANRRSRRATTSSITQDQRHRPCATRTGKCTTPCRSQGHPAGSCHSCPSISRYIVARVEAGADGPDTRFVVTNLTTRNARRLYEDVYCRRGQAENHIKSWKTQTNAAGWRWPSCRTCGPPPDGFNFQGRGCPVSLGLAPCGPRSPTGCRGPLQLRRGN